MATVALTVVGQAVGTAIGGPVIGAAAGAAIGGLAGSLIDQKYLFPAGKPPDQVGNRVLGNYVMQANEGDVLPFAAGPLCRVPTQLIYAGPFIEREEVTKIKSGGSKGESATRTEYFYFMDLAAAICDASDLDNGVSSILKIFGEGKVIYDAENTSGIIAGLSGFKDNFEDLNNWNITASGTFFGVSRISAGSIGRRPPTNREPKYEIIEPSDSLIEEITNPNTAYVDGNKVRISNKCKISVLPARIVGTEDASLQLFIDLDKLEYSEEIAQIAEIEVSSNPIGRRRDTEEQSTITFERTGQVETGVRLISSNDSVELKIEPITEGFVTGTRRGGGLGRRSSGEVINTYGDTSGTTVTFSGDTANAVKTNKVRTSGLIRIKIENNVCEVYLGNELVASDSWISGNLQSIEVFSDVPFYEEIPSFVGSNSGNTNRNADSDYPIISAYKNFILQIPANGVGGSPDDIRYNSITLYPGDFVQLPDPIITANRFIESSRNGIDVQFFDDSNFNQIAASRVDTALDYNWQDSKPDPSITNAEQFSATFSLLFTPEDTALTYQFRIRSRDFFFFTITDNNGHQIVMRSDQDDNGYTSYFTYNNDGGAHDSGGDGPINGLSFSAGRSYPCTVQYANYNGDSRINVYFRKDSTEDFQVLGGNATTISETNDSEGVGCEFIPAFRGTSYFVIEELALGDWGNRPPQLSAIVRVDDALTLAELITRICLRGGLTEEEIDVTEVPSIPVLGYVVNDDMSTLKQIYSCLTYGNLSMQDDNGTIRFFQNGAEREYLVDIDDLGAYQGSPGEPREVISFSDADIYGLPNEMQVKFYDINRDLQPGMRRARIEPIAIESTPIVNVPFSMDATEATLLAQRLLWTKYSELRTCKFVLPAKYYYINANDAILVEFKGEIFRIRITELARGNDGTIECEGVVTQTSTNSQSTTSSEINALAGELYTPMDLLVKVLNLPAIQSNSADLNNPGYVLSLARNSFDSTWRGGVLYESDDDSTFIENSNVGIEGFIGTTLNVLADGPTEVKDTGNTVDIILYNGTPASISEEELLNGRNLVLIGDEIISFQDVETLDGQGQYRLSNLIRGRYDTVDHTSTHAIGDQVVFLDTLIATFKAVSVPSINQDKYWKGPSLGQVVADVSSFQENINAENLVPFRPVDIEGSRDGSDNLTITWVRQDRADFLLLYDPPPMSEESEQYEVDIVDGVGNVIRTIDSITSPTTLYSATDQTNDGLTPGDPVNVRIYQMSAIVGRGNEGSATV